MSRKGKDFKSTDANRLKDEATKQLLFRVIQYLENSSLLSCGFQFMEYEFAQAGTFTIPHTLGFVPKDIILTGKSGAGNVTFNYDSFTNKTLSVTVTDKCTPRFFLGTYRSE